MSSTCASGAQAVADERRRKVEKPSPSCDDATSLAAELFLLEVDAHKTRQLDSYDDRNFYLETPAAGAGGEGACRRYLLKIHNGVESDNEAFLTAQNKTMQALSAADIDCPRPCSVHGVAATEGGFEDFVKFKTLKYGAGPGAGERAFAVRLLTWVDGTPLSNVKSHYGREVLVGVGRYLARLRSLLDKIDHPGCHRAHMWDLQAFLNMRAFTGAIDTEDRRALVNSILDAYENTVLPLKNELAQATLMGDFNEANIITDESLGVKGVIDFGDMLYSHRVNEIAIAMAYAMVTKYGKQDGKAIDAAVALYKGYASVCPLDAQEMEVLRVLIAGRLACSATMGAYSISQEPTNEYLKLHAEPSWAILSYFWSDTTFDQLIRAVDTKANLK